MNMSNDLMLAILAMDSYNRGYNEGLKVPGSQIGTAVLAARSDTRSDSPHVTASFFAQSYTWNGQTVISYRGTDAILADITSWATFLNNPIFATQHMLAATFYQQVLTSNNGIPILATGHSLGGSLAGFIGGIYGLNAKLFDNIAYMDYANSVYRAVTVGNAVQNGQTGPLEYVVDQAALNHYYGGQAPALPPSFPSARFSGWFLEGEVAARTRINAETALLTKIVFGAGLGERDLHNQGLLVIGLFAKDNGFLTTGKTDWRVFEHELLKSTADQKVGLAIGLRRGQTGTAGEGDQLQRALAYSSIDLGAPNAGKPYGDAAIRDLFDDANEIGKALKTPAINKLLAFDAAKIALAQIAVQFAGDTALARVIDPEARKGTFTLLDSSARLKADLDPTKWVSTFNIGTSAPNVPRTGGQEKISLLAELSGCGFGRTAA
jgi:Protein of unknown function (DUF2974)